MPFFPCSVMTRPWRTRTSLKGTGSASSATPASRISPPASRPLYPATSRLPQPPASRPLLQQRLLKKRNGPRQVNFLSGKSVHKFGSEHTVVILFYLYRLYLPAIFDLIWFHPNYSEMLDPDPYPHQSQNQKAVDIQNWGVEAQYGA